MVPSRPLVETCAWHVIRAQYVSIPRYVTIRCKDASQRSDSRTRDSQDVDTVDHGMTPPRLEGKGVHTALQHRFERLDFIEGEAVYHLIRRLLHEDLAVLHRLELE